MEVNESDKREEQRCERAVERRCGVAPESEMSFEESMSSCKVGSWEIGGAEGSRRYLMMLSRPASVIPFEAVR